MGIPFIPYPGGLPAPTPGPTSIFTSGILDFSSDVQPAITPQVDTCECGVPRSQWPAITRVYKFSLVWTFASHAEAEGIMTEFETIGTGDFDDEYPGDEWTYRCRWMNAPDIHPIEYTGLWMIKAELIGVRIT